MPLSENFRWKVIEAMFKQRGFVHHQLSTFDDFVHNGIERVVRESDITVTTPQFTYTVAFGDTYVPPPNITDDDRRKTRPLFPNEAREKDLTYDSPVFVDITETYCETGDVEKETTHYSRVCIGRIPIMLLSSVCNLATLTKPERIKVGECEWDHGGYFIIKGKERVLVGQLRGVYNQTMVLSQKPTDKYRFSAEMRSMSEETGHSVLLQTKIGTDNRSIVFMLPYVKDAIPAGVLLKSLGVLSREDIYRIVTGSSKPVEESGISTYIEYILRDSSFVETQEEALKHIGASALRIIKDTEKIGYARQVVENELFPHMGIGYDIEQKVHLLGDMIYKLLRTHIGARNPDDRDAYTNKRVEMSGVLCFELFRTLFKKFTKTLQSSIEKKKQKPDILTMISRISDLTTGLRRAFSTGSWGVPKASYIRVGVSQVMQRLSYSAGLSHLRRLAIQMGKDGKNISTKVRQPHTSQIFFVDMVECFDPETPILTWEGKVKLAKDIVVGDFLIDDKGNPTRVKSTISGESDMYMVETKKRNFMDYTVTHNHILTLKIKGHKKVWLSKRKNKTSYYQVRYLDRDLMVYKHKSFPTKDSAQKYCDSIEGDDVIDITIQDYLKLSKKIRKNLVGFKSNGVSWEKREVDLDPYILGMCLGDGFESGRAFASADPELIEVYKKWGETHDATITHHKKYQYGLSSTTNSTQPIGAFVDKKGRIVSKFKPEKAPLKKLLERYNLIDNKHIPIEYLVNDRDTRLKVLAGLIDTDGSVRANGHEIRIQQGPRNTQIVYDALFLAQSLGFSCHISTGKSQWTHTEVDGVDEKRFSTYTELTITGEYLYEIPTVLERKKLADFSTNEMARIRCNSFLQTPINITHKGVGPFVGWQLEGDGRFIGGDFSVLHNTPEGQQTGIVLNLALSSTVTRRVPTVLVREIIMRCDNLVSVTSDNASCKVLLNGALVGLTTDHTAFITELAEYRKTGLLDRNTSFTFDTLDNEVRIFSDEGRFIRPVYTVDKTSNKPFIKELDFVDEEATRRQLEKKNLLEDYSLFDGKLDWKTICEDSLALYKPINFEALVESSYIQFVDNSEVDTAVFAMEEHEIGPDLPADFLEMSPALMLGVVASTTPFPDHTQCIKSSELVLVPNGPPVPLGSLKIGDRVMSFDQNTHRYSVARVVFANSRPADKPVYTMTLVSGHSIKATHDHRFATNKGWMTIDQIINEPTTKIALSLRLPPIIDSDPNYFTIRNPKYVIDPCEFWPYSTMTQLEHLFPLKITSYKIPMLIKLARSLSFHDGHFSSLKHSITLDFVNAFEASLFSDNCAICNLPAVMVGNSVTITEPTVKALTHIRDNLNWIVLYGSMYYTNIWFDDIPKFADITCSKGQSTFLDIQSIIPVTEEVEIADITVDGLNQSFVCAQFCVHNSSRNIFQASMGKQGIGVYALSHQRRYDTTSHILTYPQRALVGTIPSTLMGFDEMPYGTNAIVAICSAGGWNQEDSVVLSQSSIDRGLFCATTYKTITVEEPKPTSHSYECVQLPPVEKRVKAYNYAHLNDTGIVRTDIPVYLKKDDVIVGKTLVRTSRDDDGGVAEDVEDVSYAIKAGEEGWVDRVLETVTPNGYKMVKVVVRNQRIPERGDKFACYHPDTEVLTNSGWKGVADITTEDQVACLVNGNTLEYHNPTETQSYDFDGELYSVESSKVSLLVTPNHRMYVGGNNRKSYKVKEAKDIYGKTVSYINNVQTWNPPEPLKTFTLPGYEELPPLELDLEAWCLFFGIWIAEGSCSVSNYENGTVHYRKVSIAANKDRVKIQLEKCMAILGLKWNIHMSRGELVSWYCSDRRLIYYLNPLSVGAVNKSLPDWCFQLDMHHSRKLVEGMVLGDGCYMGDTTTERYYTSSIKLRDDLQRLCLHAGWATNYYLKSPAGTESICLGKKIATTADYWSSTICKTQNKPLVNKYIKEGKQLDSWVKYTGKVYCCTVPTSEGIIYVRRYGKPIFSGNSRSAQKGIAGLIVRQEDMPFTQDGVTPDMMINSLAIPSRMTINVLMETVLGKSCCMSGKFGDATPFTSNSHDVADLICEELGRHGFQRQGYEVMYSGTTGEPLEARVFIGPTYYLRQKHLVSDKVHSRSHGQVTSTTRQPLEGRSRAGGLRTGEMESDVMKSHGITRMLKERLFEKSDPYQIYVCEECGNTATSPTECRICATDKVGKANLPFATKLLFQELNAMGIKTVMKLK